jgi:hypothetical protein
MASIIFSIHGYKVFLGNEVQAYVPGPNEICTAAIWCYTFGGHQLVIFFKPQGTTLPPNDTIPFQQYPGKFIGRIFVTEEKFPWFIDILRNEKPVGARIYQDTPNWNHLVVTEPVGEGEI